MSLQYILHDSEDRYYVVTPFSLEELLLLFQDKNSNLAVHVMD